MVLRVNAVAGGRFGAHPSLDLAGLITWPRCTLNGMLDKGNR
jgi:hypothetical protein